MNPDIDALAERDAADRAAVFTVMATRPHHRSSRGAFQSFMLGCEAWPDFPAGPAQPRAVRVLKALRRDGLVECLGPAGLWRLTDAGEVGAAAIRDALAAALIAKTEAPAAR
jgi:hypothetical protein